MVKKISRNGPARNAPGRRVLREECGVVGVWNHREAANIAYLGLFAQQHRGQEGAGVVALDVKDKQRFSVHKGLGLVSDVFSGVDFSSLPGEAAIGHVRYTTAGSNVASNVQPFLSEISLGKAAIAHNGNLINVNPLREQLVKDGAIFASTSDTEIILHLLARAPQRGPQGSVITEALIDALSKVKGAFSLVLLFQDRLVAVRDPHGVRPLSIAKMNGAFIVASETCAFDLIGAEFVRDVEPGELVEFFNEKDGKVQQRSLSPFGMARPAPCVFEYVYFARPDSNIFGRNVYLVRKRLGQELAKEHPVKADIVVPVPDSGVTAAIGYSEASGIPLELGLIRNHYIGRTFIEPKQAIRDFGVKIKHNANPAILKGKSVVVVDDSIVRGTTSQKLVKMLRQAGARELHMRISSPPTIDPCFYGIDTPKKDELIAPKMSIEKIKEFLGVDSLAYLSRDGMYRAVAVSGEEPSALQQRFCDACFSGHYPIGTPADHKRKQQEIL